MTKHFGGQQLSEESPLLELIWEIFKQMLEKWSNKRPKDSPRVLDQGGLLADLDFPNRGPDLVTPRVIATISAAVNKLGTFRQRPATSQIVEVVDKYAREYRVPSSSQSSIVSLLEALFSEWEPAGFKMPQEEEKQRYRVYTDGKELLCDDRKVKELRDNKLDYVIWVDMEKGEIIIDKDEKERPPPELVELLRLFLRRIGYLCSYDDIDRHIWGHKYVRSGTIHQLKYRLCKWTNDMLTPYIERRKEGYKIKTGLKYCLIELYGE